MVDKIKTQPKAIKEIAAIYIWYEEQSKGLGDKFFKELDAFFNKILRNPEHYKFVMEDVQRVLMKQFPYVIFFSIQKDKLFIVRVRHKKQMPLKRFK